MKCWKCDEELGSRFYSDVPVIAIQKNWTPYGFPQKVNLCLDCHEKWDNREEPIGAHEFLDLSDLDDVSTDI